MYRDRLLAPSETFIPRMYVAFEQLAPVYLGHRFDRARSQLNGPSNRVSDLGALGPLDDLLFRQLGRVPKGLLRWAHGLKPALIHAQFGRGGALALPLARRLGLPLVVTFHGGDATKASHYRDRPLVPTIYQRRRQALAEEAALVLCVSEHIRRTLIGRGFPEAKLVVHRLGVELRDVPGPLPAPGHRLLFVGRLVEKKGVDLLLRAAARLAGAGQPVELDLAGDGPLLEALRRQAADAGFACRFHGWLQPKEVEALMARASVLVVPSRTAASGDSEGVPTVIYEALARGLPVVASRHAGIPEVVEHERTGLLVDEDDEAGLAGALERALGDDDLWRRLQGAGLASARERFDARQQSRRLESLLLEVVERARRFDGGPGG